MSFREVAAPYPSQLVVPFEHWPAFVLPGLEVVTDDWQYWQSMYDQEHQASKARGAAAADPSFSEVMLANTISIVTNGVEHSQDPRTHNPRLEEAYVQHYGSEKGPRYASDYKEGLVRWYAHGTTFMAFSRMWREAAADKVAASSFARIEPLRHEGDPRRTSADRPASPLALPAEYAHIGKDDFVDLLVELLGVPVPMVSPRTGESNLRKFGFLARPDMFRTLFEVDPPAPGRITWLEGESVFVEAQTPAQPTTYLMDAYHNAFGADIPRQEFITARAHLKQELWPATLE